jgi:hypothetical protein
MRNLRKCQKGGDEVSSSALELNIKDGAFRAHHSFGENEISIELKKYQQ